MTAFILWVVKILGGLDIGGLVKTASDIYAKKQDTGVKREQIDTDAVAKLAEISVREAQLQASIIIAEQGSWMTRIQRPLMVFPFVAWIWKAVFWDNVVMSDWVHGRTNDLNPWLLGLMGTMIGSYFIGRTIEKTISTVRSKIASN